MKKSTVKAAKPIAAAKKAPAKAVKKPVTAPVKRAKAPAVKAPAAKSSAKVPSAKAPAVKTSAAKQPPIVITALVDIGFGNTLYLRGEGAGLSWDVGVALDCVADDQWSLTLPATSKPVVYKFLINDLSWSAGADYIAEPGANVSVTPSF